MPRIITDLFYLICWILTSIGIGYTAYDLSGNWFSAVLATVLIVTNAKLTLEILLGYYNGY